MHDQLLERRLRAALHADADAVPFTITAAELERRAVRRRRAHTGRGMTLLLAAALATSLLAVAGAMGGMFRQTVTAPTTTPTIAATPEASPLESISPPGNLPELDALVGADPSSVLFAQAHGPADGPTADPGAADVPPSQVALGDLPGGQTYQLAYACKGLGALELDLIPMNGALPQIRSTIGCDGSVHQRTVSGALDQRVAFSLSDRASWRVIARGPKLDDARPLGTTPPADPAHEEDLIRRDITLSAGAPTWGTAGLVVDEIGAVAAREDYSIGVLCSGPPVRIVFGDEQGGVITPDTETLLACYPTNFAPAHLLIPEPEGSRVYLVATPDQPVSVLVSSRKAPIALADPSPGWQVSEGIGPSYRYSPVIYSTSGSAGIAKGRIQVVLACTGTQPIVVTVGDGTDSGGPHVQHFTASCSPDGTTNTHVFTTGGRLSIVSYTALPGTWTAMTVLEPA
jgi:hypothetical protein